MLVVLVLAVHLPLQQVLGAEGVCYPLLPWKVSQRGTLAVKDHAAVQQCGLVEVLEAAAISIHHVLELQRVSVWEKHGATEVTPAPLPGVLFI